MLQLYNFNNSLLFKFYKFEKSLNLFFNFDSVKAYYPNSLNLCYNTFSKSTVVFLACPPGNITIGLSTI